jgi:aminoglycoside phosphotransferase (APT) family kinase protein
LSPISDSLEDRIAKFLRGKIGDCSDLKVSNVRKATEGFSYQTILFSASWKSQGKPFQKEFVIRIEPEDTSAIGPCDIASQFRLLRNISSEIPVPKVLWIDRKSSNLGRPFFVMEKVEGEVPITWTVEQMSEQMRKKISEEFVRILAEIHAVDWKSKKLDFLASDLKSDPAYRETERWYKIARRTQLKREPILTEAYLWLKQNKPEPQKLTLCHGDYRLGNFIWSRNKIVAVLDWEISSLSDPMSDLGWLSLKCWRSNSRPELTTGLLKRSELYSLYEKYSGNRIDKDRIFFWEVLGNMHMATILLQAFYGFNYGKIRDLRLLPMEEFLYKPILNEITQLLRW